MSNGSEYRAYVVGLDGHILSSREFVAADDDAALELTRQFVDGHDIELWNDERFVAKLEARPGEQ
jgi:hypothetical protein